jgi:hypothetical protein
MVAFASWWLNRPAPVDPIEIFQGVSYQCIEVDQPGINGLVHVAAIDLSIPGIELYFTPLDPVAVEAGWQYETRWAPQLVDEHQLSILVNGTLYGTERSIALLPNEWAQTPQTVVSNYEFNQIRRFDYLLWFEHDLTPHLERTSQISPTAYQLARWGISGGLLVDRGRLAAHPNDEQDTQTAIGVDPKRKLLFLTVFKSASPTAVSEFLLAHGVVDAVMLDGGDSSCLSIGRGAHGIVSRTLMYPRRAVATVLGVRAPRLDRPN